MDSSGLEEFYISCNPPLLPSGVKYIIERASSELSPDDLVELLYEPEIPWFKCIACSESQEMVTEVIQNLLEELLESEVDVIEPNDLGHDENLDELVDVSIIATDPHVIPWSTYSTGRVDFFENCKEVRFPESEDNLPFNEVWRGIETWNGGDIETLLRNFRYVSGYDDILEMTDIRVIIAEFEQLTSCNISYNMRKNLVYIGSKQSINHVKKAAQKLQTMLSWLTKAPQNRGHLILAETTTPFRVVYRWLSHIGLDRLTYVKRDENYLKDEDDLLMQATTLRIEAQNQHGQWIIDNTSYTSENFKSSDVSNTFSVFDGYTFPSKEPEMASMRSSIRKQAKSRGTSSIGQPATRVSSPCPSFAGDSRVFSPTHPGKFELISSWKDGLAEATASLSNTSSSITKSTVFSSKYGAELEQAPKELDHTPLEANEISGDRLEDSVPSLLDLDITPTKNSEGLKDLIDFNNEGITAMNHEPQATTLPDQVELEMADSYNYGRCLEPTTLSLLDSFESDMVAVPSIAPMNAAAKVETVLKTDQQCLDDDLISFGIREEPPLKLHRTMNQQGNRDRLVNTNASKTAGNKGNPVLKNTPQDQNSAAQVSQHIWPKPSERLTSSSVTPKKPYSYSDAARSGNEGSVKTTAIQVRLPPISQQKGLIQHPQAGTKNPTIAPKNITPSPKVGIIQPEPTEKQKSHYNPPLAVKSDILRLCETTVKEMASILRLTPGYVRLELKFGRIYFRNFSHSLVNIGKGPSFETNEMLDQINNTEYLPAECMGFSPILSTQGGDADRLAALPPGDGNWAISGTQTWYDFMCTLGPNRNDRFVLEIEAETFDYRCREAQKEAFGLFLHCPQRAWDMKVCGTHCKALNDSTQHQEFAKALVASLRISTGKADSLTVEVTMQNMPGFSVKGVKTRQVGHYRQKRSGTSMLTISLHQPMLSSAPIKGIKNLWTHRTKQNNNNNNNNNNNGPSRWIEASISSSAGSELLKQNVELEFGNEASWTCEQLETQRVFEDICRPAFGMITQMDHIGSTNNNGRTGLSAHGAYQDVLAEREARTGYRAYW